MAANKGAVAYRAFPQQTLPLTSPPSIGATGAASAPPLRGPGTASTAKVDPAGKAPAGAGGAGAGAKAGAEAGAGGSSGWSWGRKAMGLGVGGLVVVTGVGIATKHEAVPPEVYSLLGKVGLELEVPPLKSGEPRREGGQLLDMDGVATKTDVRPT